MKEALSGLETTLASDFTSDRTMRASAEANVMTALLHIVQIHVHKYVCDNAVALGIAGNPTLVHVHDSRGPAFAVGSSFALEVLTQDAAGNRNFEIPQTIRDNQSVVFVADNADAYGYALNRHIQMLPTEFPANRLNAVRAGGGAQPKLLMIDKAVSGSVLQTLRCYHLQ